MPWVYDPNARGSGYRDTETGRFLSRKALGEMLDEFITTSDAPTEALANLLAEGNISVGDWREAFRRQIKDYYIDAYILGIGGREQMTSADWGSVGGMLGEQYRYLEGFYQELLTGELSEGQIRMRMAMYINSSREAFERAQAKTADQHGFSEKAWIVDPQAEHCPDCVAIAGQGYIPVNEPFISPSTGAEAFPGSGDTVCLTSCKCHTEYR